jgi:hypothetical protein
MSFIGKLKRLLAVRASDTPGVGSGSMTEGPPTTLHEPRPTTTSLVEPAPDEPDQT